MDRMACVDVPAFPLQLLLNRRPEWKDRAVAVVDKDRPQGTVLWINRQAERSGIRSGMRYGAALSLAAMLHAAEVPKDELEQGTGLVVERLRTFSPHIEPGIEFPGVFWLDPSGLGGLYPSLNAWAAGVRAGLTGLGLYSRVAVGFTRFGSYAAAKANLGRGLIVFRTPTEETSAVWKISLGALTIAPGLRDGLEKLDVGSIGAFLDLPPGGVRDRFGEEAHRLYELAAGLLRTPLKSAPEEHPLRRKLVLETPETDLARLLFMTKRLLDPLLSDLVSRYEAVVELSIGFILEGSGKRIERIRPAAPTLDVRQIMNLVRLRLESLELGAGVEELELGISSVRLTPEQQRLFADRPRRDLDHADQALARVRAEFGAAAVVRARVREGHLPEARFNWEPLEHVESPVPGAEEVRSLIRRIHDTPIPLPPRSRNDPDGWLLRGEAHGNVEDFIGPYIVSGGWWQGTVHREYHFTEMRSGEIFWVYYDRQRRQWFLQGRVE